MNYYEHHLGDYVRDAAHLSMVEDGAYRRLLDAYYIREAPLPSLIVDCCKLARATTKAEREAVAYVLVSFFREDDTGWRHRRCDAEIAAYLERLGKNRTNGKLGGRPKKAKPKDNPGVSGAEPKRKASSLQAPDSSLSEAIASGGSSPPQPVDLIFGLGLPALLAASVPEKNARTMLGLMRKTHGDDAVVRAVQRMAEERPLEPVAWLQATLKSALAPAKTPNGFKSFRERDTQAKAERASAWTGGRIGGSVMPPAAETLEMEAPSASRLDHD